MLEWLSVVFNICGTLLLVTLIVGFGFILKLFVRREDLYYLFGGIKKDPFRKLAQRVKGPQGVPLFWNTFQFLVSPEDLLPLLSKWARESGHRFIYRVGTYWIVGLCNPKDVEKLLISTTETVKSDDYEQLIPWLGTGLLISDGEKWMKRRKLLTPAFHFKILEKFMNVFNHQSFKFVETIRERCKPGEDEFDIVPFISKMSLDIICETAMGVKIGAQDMKEESDYIKAIARLKWLQNHRALRPWLGSEIIWDALSYGKEEKALIRILHDFTNKVIQQRKSEREKDQEVSISPTKSGRTPAPAVFLDLLLEAQRTGALESDEDVREETDTFMFEGHDTVSAAIAFSLFLIGSHSKAEERIQAELKSVFGEDSSRSVTMDDLGRLKYLDCCVKESLRLCPSVPIIARNIQDDFELESDIILPRDTLVIILPYQLHRNPEVFPDADCFKPERFSSNGEKPYTNPFSYVPFSAGPRNCIGQKFALMEMKVILTNIMRNIKIVPVLSGGLKDLTLMGDMILRSKDGIKVRYYDNLMD